MPKKTVIGYFEGVTIKVENTWFHGMSLYLNDQFIQKNTQLFSIDGNNPIMSYKYSFLNGEKEINIFCQAILTTKIKICVENIIVGGELF